jgi:hypothetical protein
MRILMTTTKETLITLMFSYSKMHSSFQDSTQQASSMYRHSIAKSIVLIGVHVFDALRVPRLYAIEVVDDVTRILR